MGSYKGIYWKGRQIIIPGAYSYVDAEAMVPNRLSPANTIGAVGTCKGGQPNVPLRVSSLKEAVALLRDGDLKRAAELMYDPSSDVNGAGEVVFVRVGNPTQSALVLDTNKLSLASVDYGEHNNFIRMKIEAGTTSGKKVTIEQQLDDMKEIQDNLGNCFIVDYVGSGTAAAMSINTSTKKLTIVVDTVTILTLPLDVYPTNTIKGIVEVLDGHADLTCTLDPDGDGTLDAALLETLTSQSILTAYTVSTQVGSIHHWINAYSQLVASTLGASPSGSITNIPFTHFASGGDGTTFDTAAWSTALSKLETEEDIRLLYVTASDAAVHAIASTHCTQMSDIKTAKERILICGGAASETVAQALTRGVNLGDKRSCIVYPGVKRYNITTGVLDTLSPAISAAIVAGMAGGVNPEEPLTYKTIKVQGLEKTLTDTEVEQLLGKGVIPLTYVRADGIYHIVQSITTWQKDANVIFRKLSGMRIHDYLRQETRNTAKVFIGRVADATAMLSIKNAVASKLDALTRTAQNSQGVLTPALVDGVIGPSYRNLVVTFDGFDWVQVSFEAHPVGEIAYITIDCKLKPAQLSA